MPLNIAYYSLQVFSRMEMLIRVQARVGLLLSTAGWSRVAHLPALTATH